MEAARWMHGVDELATMRAVLAHDADTLTSAHDLRELAQCVAARDLGALKSMQLRRIVQWYQQVGPMVRDDEPHLDCHRSMLAQLASPRLDLEAYRELVHHAVAHNVSFAQLDADLLNVASLVVHGSDDDTQLQGLVDLLGRAAGAPYMVVLLERTGNHCADTHCPETAAAVARVWRWAARVDWQPVVAQLQRIACFSYCAVLYHELAAHPVLGVGLANGGPLHFVRNADVCRAMVRSARVEALEEPLGTERKTPLVFDGEWPQGGVVSQALLQAGARPEPLLTAQRINPAVVEQTLALHPHMRDTLLGETVLPRWIAPCLFASSRQRAAAARVLKRYRVVVPDALVATWLEAARRETVRNSHSLTAWLCALVHVGYCDTAINQYVEQHHCTWTQDELTALFPTWSWECHHYCPRTVQAQAERTVQVLRCAQPALPAELVTVIVQRVMQ